MSSDETLLTRVHSYDRFKRTLAGWYHQMCECDVCMPACFMRQSYIVIAILTRLHADGSGRRQDPPGFAAVVHHIPYQLIARLVCQSGRAKVYRLQLLAHAHQQSASDVQIHHQQPAYTSTKPARILAVNIFFFMTIKQERRTLIAFRSRCLNRHSHG